MLTASPSPRLTPSLQSGPVPAFNPPPPRSHYDNIRKSSISSSPIVKPYSTHVDAAPQPTKVTSQCSRDNHHALDVSIISTTLPPGRRNMVDAGTQYSPPPGYHSPSTTFKHTPAPQVAQLKIVDPKQDRITPSAAMTQVATQELAKHEEQSSDGLHTAKRHASTSGEVQPPKHPESQSRSRSTHEQGPLKRARGEEPPTKIMPIKYETCDPRELVLLISSMLMELIRYNDAIPLKDGHLTRFHSRAPPGISVQDYLQRLTTHATLPPPILLSMVYYIDKLCALYPAFTISSLTVHRFLITSATVASKGLSDSFWTNKTYAKVGGVSVKELALLEMEFLIRVQWRIVPQPEILVDYYRSLVERSPGYEIEQPQST